MKDHHERDVPIAKELAVSEVKSQLSKLFGSRKLKGISDIRTFFRTNEQPIFFIGPTAFNLLGIDRWVRNF